jgi:hypothetical protein
MLPCFPVDRTQSSMIVKFGFFGYYKKRGNVDSIKKEP